MCITQSGPPDDSDTPSIIHSPSPATERVPHAAPRVPGAAAPDGKHREVWTWCVDGHLRFATCHNNEGIFIKRFITIDYQYANKCFS